MRPYLILLLCLLSLATFGQSKYSYIHFDNLTEVEGTEFVIASIDNRSKMADGGSKYLLFIDTKTGSTPQVDIPKDGYVRKIEQVKIDSLEINRIIVSAKTVDLDRENGID